MQRSCLSIILYQFLAICLTDYSLILQLVFLVLTGEAWGFLGSRRFLHELDLQSEVVAGLNSTLIETVIFHI